MKNYESLINLRASEMLKIADYNDFLKQEPLVTVKSERKKLNYGQLDNPFLKKIMSRLPR
jgi:hypothetical protein